MRRATHASAGLAAFSQSTSMTCEGFSDGEVAVKGLYLILIPELNQPAFE